MMKCYQVLWIICMSADNQAKTQRLSYCDNFFTPLYKEYSYGEIYEFKF